MYKRIHNFGPGPAVLPVPVLERLRENLLNFKDSGIGVLELSHRGKEFEAILHNTDQTLRDVLNITNEYELLYTTGGASAQFSMVPLNLLSPEHQGNYLISGTWAQLAAKEAHKFGQVHIAGSTEDLNFKETPEIQSISAKPAYLHFTSNNTIYGTQYHQEPDLGGYPDCPLVCDASSDIACRPIDINKYGLIYAGAQKNLGVAGVTLVILKKELLARSPESLPIMYSYQTYAKNHSLYNTPPTFAIYVLGEVASWIKEQGGLPALKRANEAKAALLYAAIDQLPIFSGVAAPKARSIMNVTFRLTNPELEESFLKAAEQAGLSGLRGHRSVGGIRASLYNACPLESVKALVEFMEEFNQLNL